MPTLDLFTLYKMFDLQHFGGPFSWSQTYKQTEIRFKISTSLNYAMPVKNHANDV